MPLVRKRKSMVAMLDGKSDKEKLEDLRTLKYEYQAKWFLNAVRTISTAATSSIDRRRAPPSPLSTD